MTITTTDELAAMRIAGGAIEALDDKARGRVMLWLYERFGGHTDDARSPRTFGLDDLPGTGDVVDVGGDRLEVVNATHTVAGGHLVSRIIACGNRSDDAPTLADVSHLADVSSPGNGSDSDG